MGACASKKRRSAGEYMARALAEAGKMSDADQVHAVVMLARVA